MGVPSFFRWLCMKYPRIISDCKDEATEDQNGIPLNVNLCNANPNGFEIDNLYLDMNGIIHPCCHPENKAAPPSEDDMIRAVFMYIDHIFSICRPRKILYMAIDGVAPRAKMNQQRARRFVGAKERSEKAGEMEKMKQEWREAGLEVPDDLPEEWDSNVITPGTPFMARLSQCLHFYIASRIQSNPAWQNIKVI